MNFPINIGDAAKAAGVSTKMIRNYESIGLLPPAERSSSGYRIYGERDVSVLRFIRQSRRLGFSMEQIAALICLWSNKARSSREVKAAAVQHLLDLELKIQELTEMKNALQRMVSACSGDDHSYCAILEDLARDSSTLPTHNARVSKKGRKIGVSNVDSNNSNSKESSSHLDLMAWTLGAHVHHETH